MINKVLGSVISVAALSVVPLTGVMINDSAQTFAPQVAYSAAMGDGDEVETVILETPDADVRANTDSEEVLSVEQSTTETVKPAPGEPNENNPLSAPQMLLVSIVGGLIAFGLGMVAHKALDH